MNVKDASSAGCLLRVGHVTKPNDSIPARLNLQRIKGISSILESLDKEVKTDLSSTLKSSGRIKTAGRKTAHDFDESMLTKISTVKDNLQKIKTKFVQFESQVTAVFKFKFAAGKRKSRSQKQNKHYLEARKKKRECERTSEVLGKFSPNLEEGFVCDKANLDDTVISASFVCVMFCYVCALCMSGGLKP